MGPRCPGPLESGRRRPGSVAALQRWSAAAAAVPVVARPRVAGAPLSGSAQSADAIALQQRLAMAAAACSSGRSGGSSGGDKAGWAAMRSASSSSSSLTTTRRRDIRAAASKDGGGKSGSGKGSGKSSGGSGGGGKSGGKSGGGGGGSPAKKGKSAADDKADRDKADFSAYWSLRFREFFSGRRQYLELARKRQGPPEAVQKVDAQIAEASARLEAATQAGRDRRRAKYEAEVLAEAAAAADALGDEGAEALRRGIESGEVPTSRARIAADADAARAALRSPLVKYAAIPAIQLRALALALIRAPLAVPGAALAAWRAALSKRRYEAFLLAEGERVWFWRNRMENERWFWEAFLFDRLLVPVAFTLAYLYLAPPNLLWSFAVPMLALYWQDGRLPHPGNLLWWVVVVFGLYGKCWPQVASLLGMLFNWS